MPSVVSPEILASIKKLHHAGRYVDAWNLAQDLPPPEEWEDIDARMNAAALISRLGDSKRTTRMVFKAWREPCHRPAVREDMFWEVLGRRGAFLAWRWLEKNAPGPEESAECQCDHQARLATVLMRLRDFERAGEALDKAAALQPGERCLTLIRSDLLREQDLREEALALAQEIAEAEPDYVAAIDATSELLVELGDDEAAVNLLQQSLALVQAGSLARSLTGLLVEMQRFEEAAATLDMYEKFMPLMDQEGRDWMAGVRCDLASNVLDLPAALHWARQVQESGFYHKLVAKLEACPAGEWRRVLLPVPHVQQHEVTCGPASLASIAAFWGREVEHLEVAAEICYDGTPPHKEREWAEGEGWAVREFKVTLESAQALIDAGMPFALSTVHPGGAHAQVVAGYDDRRTVFFIREPGDRQTNEFLAAESLELQAPFGPRGLVMVPAEHADRLAALDLPDAAAFDLLHQINLALSVHDREAAAAALEALRADHPGGTLRWRAELRLAAYDSNAAGQLSALEELLRMHPTVENWQTSRIHLIEEVHGREAMLAELTALCGQEGSHPLHWLMLAQQLRHNDSRIPEARRLLRRVLRDRLEAEALKVQADLLWRDMRHAEAHQIYRLASCLAIRDEDHALAYFKAARWVGEDAAALQHLRRRFEQEGEFSSAPAVTLYRALDLINHSAEALDVLEQSLAQHPDDTDHAVFVAGELVLWNRLARAREILGSVTRTARAAAWHRVQARLAAAGGDSATELKHQRAVLRDSPQDTAAHRAIATLLDLQEGKPAGREFLRQACAQHRFCWHLHLVWLDWAREAGLPEAEAVVRELLRIDPDDAWAVRELAEILGRQRRHAEAHAELDKAEKIHGQSAAQLTVRAGVMENEGRLEEARELYRRAACLDVDSLAAQAGLVRLSRSEEQRQQALRLIQQQLQSQFTIGDAVIKFAEDARTVLDATEQEQTLRQLHEKRPDLWQTAAALAEHLRAIGRVEEAVAVAAECARRFPMLPRVWWELGRNLEAAGRRREGIEAASKIRELNPAWSFGMRGLSEMLRKEGRYQEAREVLEESLRRDAQDSLTHGWLAEVLWNLEEKDAALAHLQRSVELEPAYGWSWDMLERWGKAAGRPDAVKTAVERLQTQRPGEARTWNIAARRLIHPNDLPARLAAVDKAISLAPDDWAPVELKAHILGDAGRFEEALCLCREHPSGAVELRFREGWLLRQKGRTAEAVQVVEAALALSPRHVWPWQLLSDWHEKDGRLPEAEKACRTLILLEPDTPAHLATLAHLLLVQKKRAEAKAAFAEAWKQAPHDEYAFQRLFWLRVEDKEWAAAEQQLKDGHDFFTAIHLLSRQFILSCRRQHWDATIHVLGQILADTGADEAALNRVHDELRGVPEPERARQARRHQQVVLAHLRRPESCNPGAGKLYVQLCMLLDQLPERAVLEALPLAHQARQLAFMECFDWLGQRWARQRGAPAAFWLRRGRHEKQYVFGLIETHREWLRGDVDLYGMVSYALRMGGCSHETINWLADWQERGAEIAPYILNNLVLSLQETAQAAPAAAVARHGMTLARHDGTKMRFHLWCGIESLLQGDLPEAERLTGSVVPDQLDSYGKKLHDFYLLLHEHQSGSPPAFSHSRQRLDQFMSSHRKNKVMRAACGQACQIISQKLGHPLPRLWHATWPGRRFLKTFLA